MAVRDEETATLGHGDERLAGEESGYRHVDEPWVLIVGEVVAARPAGRVGCAAVLEAGVHRPEIVAEVPYELGQPLSPLHHSLRSSGLYVTRAA